MKQLLFYFKNYSFLPDNSSFTQAHTIFGLHTVPNNYINLDNGLILYQCEKELLLDATFQLHTTHMPLPLLFLETVLKSFSQNLFTTVNLVRTLCLLDRASS